MAGVIITEEMLAVVRRARACLDRINAYHAGQTIEEVAAEDLAWVESVLPYFAAKIAVSAQTSDYVVWGTLPLSGYGYGYGYGDGSGNGGGSGGGSGDGDGYGDGDVDGSGHGQ